ncbi:MAG: glycosyltransferase family 10 domain-containing protein [Chloroflexota bacterium]
MSVNQVTREGESATARVAIYLDPFSYHYLGDKIFAVNDPAHCNGDSVLAPYVYLRDYFAARGIPVHTVDYLDGEPGDTRNVYVSFGMLEKYQQIARRRDTTVSAFFAVECPIVEPSEYRALREASRVFKRIFTWTDSRSLEPFVGVPLACQRFYWPQAFDRVHEAIWNRTDRKFLVMINANKLPRIYDRELYTERLRAIAYFAQYDEIDLFGPGWNEPPIRVGRTWVPYTAKRLHRAGLRWWDLVHPDPALVAARRVYRGIAASKSETVGQYTFALCFENMILKGWITEKIFDCFYSGTVPIYWGDPEIETIVPPNCYVDMRQFSGYPDLRAFLKSRTPDQIQAYREAARAYLSSPQARPFTKDALVDIFRRIVKEDTGVDVA